MNGEMSTYRHLHSEMIAMEASAAAADHLRGSSCRRCSVRDGRGLIGRVRQLMSTPPLIGMLVAQR